MEVKTVTIAIGSNLGNREELIQQALHSISEDIGEIVKCSPFYSNHPQGFESKELFLNGCVLVESTMDTEAVLHALQAIEAKLGRVRNQTVGYSSRTIDLDIILRENERLNTPNLTIPHPRFRERLFVLKPLNDIQENAIDPITKKSIKELLEHCQDTSALIFHELNTER
jgi:deoxyguanosine kinase